MLVTCTVPLRFLGFTLRVGRRSEYLIALGTPNYSGDRLEI
jgi:hypothetical protein